MKEFRHGGSSVLLTGLHQLPWLPIVFASTYRAWRSCGRIRALLRGAESTWKNCGFWTETSKYRASLIGILDTSWTVFYCEFTGGHRRSLLTARCERCGVTELDIYNLPKWAA